MKCTFLTFSPLWEWKLFSKGNENTSFSYLILGLMILSSPVEIMLVDMLSDWGDFWAYYCSRGGLYRARSVMVVSYLQRILLDESKSEVKPVKRPFHIFAKGSVLLQKRGWIQSAIIESVPREQNNLSSKSICPSAPGLYKPFVYAIMLWPFWQNVSPGSVDP